MKTNFEYRTLRARANEAEEVLHPEESKWTITVSALEKVRFEENKKMGENI